MDVNISGRLGRYVLPSTPDLSAKCPLPVAHDVLSGGKRNSRSSARQSLSMVSDIQPVRGVSGSVTVSLGEPPRHTRQDLF
jgi:hypothetical protein